MSESMLNEAQSEEFQKLAKAMMKFLCESCHPHVHVVIEPTTTELSSGETAFTTYEFVRD